MGLSPHAAPRGALAACVMSNQCAKCHIRYWRRVGDLHRQSCCKNTENGSSGLSQVQHGRLRHVSHERKHHAAVCSPLPRYRTRGEDTCERVRRRLAGLIQWPLGASSLNVADSIVKCKQGYDADALLGVCVMVFMTSWLTGK